ncbi:MAG: hypothetical protein ACR2MG_05415 [Pyrinomonadaceae bacterium]
MKSCRTCGIENSDAMRFCVECGTPLTVSPMVVNVQNSGTQGQENVPPTVFGGNKNTGGGQQNFSPGFPNAPTQKPKGYGKIFLILGGVFALFLLLLTAGAAIIFFNWQSNNPVVVADASPTPSPTRTAERKSPTPSRSVSPTVSPNVLKDDEPPPPKSDSDARADFDKVWVDYNVTDKGRLGMRIHVKFTVHNMKNVDSDLAIYFQREDGTKILTNNKEFASKDGQVAVYRALKPSYDETVYEDLQLFIPYTEFNLSRGKYKLKLDADLINKNGDLVQHLTFYDFEYEKP